MRLWETVYGQVLYGGDLSRSFERENLKVPEHRIPCLFVNSACIVVLSPDGRLQVPKILFLAARASLYGCDNNFMKPSFQVLEALLRSSAVSDAGSQLIYGHSWCRFVDFPEQALALSTLGPFRGVS